MKKKHEARSVDATGVQVLTQTKAIRYHCLDCCCYEINRVMECENNGVDGRTYCALWPYRMGRNPAGDYVKTSNISEVPRNSERLLG